MENFERQEEIVKYLDRYYFVKEGIFFNKQHEQEWGVNLLEYLVKIFCHDVDFTHDTLKDWYYSKGYDENAYNLSLGSRKLLATWSFDKITDLQRYGVMDAEAELIKMISDEIAKEIDAQILKDLKGQIKHKEDFFEVLECIGITTTPTFYNPMTFSPQKGFITSTYEQRENARKNNVIWNYWVRTRGLHT
tara:strand:- start:784 stop:1356 length:573 start_codon:yes stop_codon:yes gene_type:complete